MVLPKWASRRPRKQLRSSLMKKIAKKLLRREISEIINFLINLLSWPTQLERKILQWPTRKKNLSNHPLPCPTEEAHSTTDTLQIRLLKQCISMDKVCRQSAQLHRKGESFHRQCKSCHCNHQAAINQFWRKKFPDKYNLICRRFDQSFNLTRTWLPMTTDSLNLTLTASLALKTVAQAPLTLRNKSPANKIYLQ